MGSWWHQLPLFSRKASKAGKNQPQMPLERSVEKPQKKLSAPPLATSQSKAVRQRVSESKAPLNMELHALLWEVAQSIDDFRSYNFRRMLVSVGTSRSQGKFGIWAHVTPLRYIGGKLYRKGIRYGVPGKYFYELKGVDLTAEDSPLYLITVMMPRFFQLTFAERLETLVHELYHIHPDFRGDLRRFPRPHVHHGPTPKQYDEQVRRYCAEALSTNPALKSHPVLSSGPESFLKLKKRRISSPTLKFQPEILATVSTWILFLVAGLLISYSFPGKSQEIQSTYDELSRSQDVPTPYVSESVLPEHAIESFDYFDQTRGARNFPRFIVSPTETIRLKSAPSDWSADLLVVDPSKRFLAYDVDQKEEWVFLRSRSSQGWILKSKIRILGQLDVPRGGGRFSGLARTERDRGFGTIKDGDPLYIPNSPQWDSGQLEGFDAAADEVVATTPGPLYESPDPLATRFGIIEEGDRLLVLQKDETGDWAYVRLLLTEEEGWFPSERLQVEAGRKVLDAGKGQFIIDVDGSWGSAGRNLGLGVGGFYGFQGAQNLYARRLEAGIFYQASVGERASLEGENSGEVFEFSTFYNLYGILLRYASIGRGGLFGGSVGGGVSFQQVSADFSGLDADVVSSNGLNSLIQSRLGVLIELRGLYSITPTIQANALFRTNLATESNSFFTGLGVSFRFR